MAVTSMLKRMVKSHQHIAQGVVVVSRARFVDLSQAGSILKRPVSKHLLRSVHLGHPPPRHLSFWSCCFVMKNAPGRRHSRRRKHQGSKLDPRSPKILENSFAAATSECLCCCSSGNNLIQVIWMTTLSQDSWPPGGWRWRCWASWRSCRWARRRWGGRTPSELAMTGSEASWLNSNKVHLKSTVFMIWSWFGWVNRKSKAWCEWESLSNHWPWPTCKLHISIISRLFQLSAPFNYWNKSWFAIILIRSRSCHCCLMKAAEV